WTKLGSGGSTDITNGAVTVTFDPDHPETFWESGMYGPAAYQTTDNGSSFTRLGTIEHVDVMSIDFSDADRKTLLAGAHEQKQKLYKSTDGGGTWNDIGMNMPAGSHFSSYPHIIDSQTFLVGCSGWGDGTAG